MSNYKINKDGTTEPCSDLKKCYDSKEKYGRVGSTEIGDATVSTVFLVLDHSYNGTPQLFETMVFGGENDGYMRRYETYDEALKGHKEVVENIKRKQTEDKE